MPFSYEYPRPALTVDCAVFRPVDGSLEILLVERDQDPFAGSWATPGGFVETDETVRAAAFRELHEETALQADRLHQFGVFSDPDRDPRGRVISNGYWTLVTRDARTQAASDARDTAWHDIDDLPSLAFDHADIVSEATDAIRRAARTGPIGYHLLTALEPFEWSDVIDLYTCVLEAPIDADRLTAAWLRSDLVDETPEGLRCRHNAFDRAERKGVSPWLIRSPGETGRSDPNDDL